MYTPLATSPQKIPVTVITGFLGNGKTTLLNYILKNFEDYKVAVLVNEFGDINIDSQLLIAVEEDMIELTNGCICCTINGNLAEAVYRILERSSQVDYLIVETTSVADPLPIALTFLGTDLRDLTHLDSIILLSERSPHSNQKISAVPRPPTSRHRISCQRHSLVCRKPKTSSFPTQRQTIFH
jgi:G3E family GTPase